MQNEEDEVDKPEPWVGPEKEDQVSDLRVDESGGEVGNHRHRASLARPVDQFSVNFVNKRAMMLGVYLNVHFCFKRNVLSY